MQSKHKTADAKRWARVKEIAVEVAALANDMTERAQPPNVRAAEIKTLSDKLNAAVDDEDEPAETLASA